MNHSEIKLNTHYTITHTNIITKQKKSKYKLYSQVITIIKSIISILNNQSILTEAD